MTNFYTQYDCTKLNTSNDMHTTVRSWGPKVIQHVSHDNKVIEIYNDFMLRMKEDDHFDRYIQMKVISNHGNFKIVEYDYTSDTSNWHYKYRFGISKHVWNKIHQDNLIKSISDKF